MSGSKKNMKKLPKGRNFVAKALASPLFRQRVVKSKRAYSRKVRSNYE